MKVKVKNINKTIAVFMVLLLIGATFSVGAVSKDIDPDNKYKYEEFIIPKALEHPDAEYLAPELSIICYDELYERYSTTSSEAEPDYVVVNISSNFIGDWDAEVFGDYVIRKDSRDIPYSMGYIIYVPAEDKIYTLPEAYEFGFENLDIIFTDLGVGELIGDMDKDRKITIKDASYIQKGLANLIEFENDEILPFIYEYDKAPLCYISDFNRDCQRSIQDVSAIQKYLAQME